ncbi:hypothetical protein SSP24_48530 [Streptomyces spinoverrucosus]|uniref:Uncharacterized protein n=1 Tax=Streptomyces spinoverrucosus TaxID=284043 RepID=A0A4Y3VM03_9ACTN|nr:hypothetical protein SSP24_48530 [Streptomyces spinoverrucosus]GHB90410.1 hypothetical protein GCM10010397_73200 [Streptomyces spinoverrucosus]
MGMVPARFPVDNVAAQRLREFLDMGAGGLDALGLDLSTDAKLTNVKLVGAEIRVGEDKAREEITQALESG